MNVQKISQCCEEKLQNKDSNSDEQPINGYEEKNESKDIPNDGKLSPLRFINSIIESDIKAIIVNWRQSKNINTFIGDVLCPITVRVTDDEGVGTTSTYFYKFYEIIVIIQPYTYIVKVHASKDNKIDETHKTKYDEKVAELAEIYNIKYTTKITNIDTEKFEEILNTRFQYKQTLPEDSFFKVVVSNLNGGYSDGCKFYNMVMSNIMNYVTLVNLDKSITTKDNKKCLVLVITCSEYSNTNSKNNFNEIFGEDNCCLVLIFGDSRIYFSAKKKGRYGYLHENVRMIKNQKALLTN